jgi:hypothetical protein
VIRVAIQSDVMADGVRIAVLNKGDGTTHVARGLGAGGLLEWERTDGADAGSWQDPTMVLPDDIARALMDELIRHYHGSSDTLALRRDYDHERQRYDKAVAALIELAARPQQIQLRKAEQ